MPDTRDVHGAAPAQNGASIYQLLITLDGIRPPIRRRVLVPADLSLAELHAVIQAAMGWQDYHLWRFEIDGVEYGERLDDGWDAPVRSARAARLDAVAGPRSVLGYEYDFGDSWEHRVRVERVRSAEPGQAYPVCVLAERACPPEDCGGVWGYAALLEVLANPRHPEYAERRAWLGGRFDPEAVDVAAINRRLARLQRTPRKSRRARRPSTSSSEDRSEAGPLPDDLRAEIEHILERVVAEQPTATIDELNAALATLTTGYNARPQAELGGLSPAAVQRLLDADWDGPASAVQIDSALSLDDLASARTLHDVRLLLELLVEDGPGKPVKATPKGKLPRAVVTRFRERMSAPATTQESWALERRVLNEEDLARLHHGRVLSELAGLVQRRAGVFRRTRRGDQLAAAERAGALFARLLRTHFRKLNLAYLDGAGPAPGFQYSIGYTLYRFGRVGSDWKTPSELTGELLLPAVREELAADTSYDRAALVLQTRCLRPLEGFGLAEAREVPHAPGDLLRQQAYRKAPLFDRVFRFDTSVGG